MRIPGVTAAIIESEDEHLSLAEQVARDYQRYWSRPPTPAEQALNIRHALDSWPESLHALSIPSAGLQLTDQERDSLSTVWGDFEVRAEYPSLAALWEDSIEAFASMRTSKGERLCDVPSIANLVIRITAYIESLPFEAPFFKLGTRSPKDSPYWPACNGRVRNGEEVALLAMTSPRFCQDILTAQMESDILRGKGPGILGFIGKPKHDPARQDYLPWLWFREYRSVPEFAEFRCFMRDKAFVGGTQYHRVLKLSNGHLLAADPFPEIVAHGYEYEALIKEWFPTFAAACDYNSAVFDVAVDLDTRTVTLIETNPANARTFSGLKDWRSPESFNGELDWVAEPIRSREIRIDPDRVRKLQAREAAFAQSQVSPPEKTS